MGLCFTEGSFSIKVGKTVLKPNQFISDLQGKKEASLSIVKKSSSSPQQKDVIDHVTDAVDIPSLIEDLMKGRYSNAVTLKIHCSTEELMKPILKAICMVCLPSLTTLEIHSMPHFNSFNR